ncbi:MAG: glycosyltransferase family 39 protein [Ruminococcus sp.]
MIKERISKSLCRVFSIILFVSMSCTFICLLIFGYRSPEVSSVTLKICVILFFGVLTATVIWLYYLFNNSNTKLRKAILTSKQTNTIIFVAVGILFLIQLFIGYKLRANTVTDLARIEKYALYFAENGNFNLIQDDYSIGKVYLVKYPNNVALTVLLATLYKISYSVFGCVPKMVPIALNCLAINLSVLFTTFTAKKLFGNKQALIALALCMLFAPYYTYTPYYYTDSLSLPFLIGSVYLFVSAIKAENKYKKYAMLVLFGGVVFLGFKMKATVVFVLVCGLIYALLRFNVKRFLAISLAVIVGFSSVGIVYTESVNSLNLCTKEQSYESEYPVTHWIMMGLKGVGRYNRNDSKFTMSFKNKDEKQKANIEEIKKRVKEYGITGFVKHSAKKAVWIWEDGTYFISHHIEKPIEKNILHSFVLTEGEYHDVFYIYSCGFQLFLIFMMMLSAFKGCIKPKVDKTIFLKGLLFSIFIFLLIWEARSRYLYNFTPVFILLATDGLKTSGCYVKRLLKIGYGGSCNLFLLYRKLPENGRAKKI